jgi:hypothetical protein
MRDPAADEIRVFSEARPEVRGFPGDARARARARLLEAVRADEARAQRGHAAISVGGAFWRQARAVRRVRTAVLAGVAAVAASVLAATLTLLMLPGSPVPLASRAAVAVLESAAVTAASGPRVPVPGPGQYLYVRDIEFKSAAGPGATRWARECTTLIRQEWMAPDHSGRQVGSYASRGCRGFEQRWPKGGAAGDNPLSWPLNLLSWEGLPARPAALERAIVQRYENGHALSTATFAYAAALLQEDAPPAFRAALYRVIELLPGIVNLGPATDRLGRHGIAVGLTQHGERQELIFDPATSRGLEEEIVAAGPKQDGNNYQPAGTVLGYTIYVISGVVRSDTAALPAAGPERS